jgi:hypothetical protein
MASNRETAMSLTNKLLKLAAKVALDRLIGGDRTNELVDMFM